MDQTFRAMGSSCRILLRGKGVDAAPLRGRLDLLERRWSRFLPESEVSQLNRSSGTPTLVSNDVIRLLLHAEDAVTLTGGLFDPTMLFELEELGYDVTHELLPEAEGAMPGDGLLVVSESPRRSRFAEIEVDAALGAVTMPAGVGFDPGGIGKGLAADVLAEDALAAGADGVLVELGGDLRIAGEWVDGGVWPVRVADPFDRAVDRFELRVGGGGIATSSRLRRRWIGPDGEAHHHVLDPRTGRPAVTDLVAVIVHASHTWVADVLAKAALIAGRERAMEMLTATEVGAVLVDEAGFHDVVGPLEPEVLS